MQVAERCGAAYGERSADRTNSRNGTRSRALETRLGPVELEIPKLLEGSLFPLFLQPRRRWEQAIVNVVAQAYVAGVSTRKVEAVVEAMGAQGMSKSEVSRMAAALDAEVEAFRNRTLSGDFPYIWLDAMYIKVRENSRIVSNGARRVRRERGRPARGPSCRSRRSPLVGPPDPPGGTPTALTST